ncbi:MAG TPA: hypothetical protein VF424_02575, partial [Vicinamibacterales bacterium]
MTLRTAFLEEQKRRWVRATQRCRTVDDWSLETEARGRPQPKAPSQTPARRLTSANRSRNVAAIADAAPLTVVNH